MEGLAPPLECIILVRSFLEDGRSIREAAREFSKHSSSDFAFELLRCLLAVEQGRDWTICVSAKSVYQRTLLEILVSGVQGHPVIERLAALQEELTEVCSVQIQEHIDLLPFKAMIPLFLFQFPAFLLLLFGPILRAFVKGISE